MSNKFKSTASSGSTNKFKDYSGADNSSNDTTSEADRAKIRAEARKTQTQQVNSVKKNIAASPVLNNKVPGPLGLSSPLSTSKALADKKKAIAKEPAQTISPQLVKPTASALKNQAETAYEYITGEKADASTAFGGVNGVLAANVLYDIAQKRVKDSLPKGRIESQINEAIGYGDAPKDSASKIVYDTVILNDTLSQANPNNLIKARNDYQRRKIYTDVSAVKDDADKVDAAVAKFMSDNGVEHNKYYWPQEAANAVVLGTKKPDEYTLKNIDKYRSRAIALASLSNPTSEQRDEINAILKVIDPMYFTSSAAAGATGLASELNKKNIISAIGEDAYNEWQKVIPRLETALHPVAEAVKAAFARGTGIESLAKLVSSKDVGNQINEDYSVRTSRSQLGAMAGNLAGSLLLFSGVGNVAGAVGSSLAGSIGSLTAGAGSTAIKFATSAATGAMTFAAVDAIQNAGNVATGEMTERELFTQMGKSEIIGAATSLASNLVRWGFDAYADKTATKMAVSRTAERGLSRFKVNGNGTTTFIDVGIPERRPLLLDYIESSIEVRTPLYNFARNMTSGLAGSAAYVGSNYLLADEKPSGKEIAFQFAYGFISSLISSSVDSFGKSKISRTDTTKFEEECADFYDKFIKTTGKAIYNDELSVIKEASYNPATGEINREYIAQYAESLISTIEKLRSALATGNFAEIGKDNALVKIASAGDVQRAVLDYYLYQFEDMLAVMASSQQISNSVNYTVNTNESVAALTNLIGSAMESGITQGEVTEVNAESTATELISTGVITPTEPAVSTEQKLARIASEPQGIAPIEERPVSAVEPQGEVSLPSVGENAENGQNIAPQKLPETKVLWDNFVESANFGESGKELALDIYDKIEIENLPDAANELVAFYNAGKKGTPADEVMPGEIGVLPFEDKARAYIAGKYDNSIEGGTTNGRTGEELAEAESVSGRGDLRFGEVSRRVSGARQDERAGGLYEDRRGESEGNIQRIAGGESEQRESNITAYRNGENAGSVGQISQRTVRRVSTKELGVPTGTSQKNNTVTTDTNTKFYHWAKKVEPDVELNTVSGDMEVDDFGGKFRVNGVQYYNRNTGRLGVLLRSDDPKFTTEQLGKHEYTHISFRKGKASLEKAARFVENIYNKGGDAEFNALVQAYYDKYWDKFSAKVREISDRISAAEANGEDTAELKNQLAVANKEANFRVIEEMYCDAVAKMNRFEDYELDESTVKSAQDTVRRAYGASRVKDGIAASGDGEARYSNQIKWRTGFSSKEFNQVLDIANREYSRSNKWLDNGTKWLYNEINSKKYFALYSRDKNYETTILYASKGKAAEYENAWLDDFLTKIGGENNVVTNANNGRSTGYGNRLFGVSWSIPTASGVNNAMLLSNRTNTLYDLHSKSSRRRISRALQNCIEDSIGRREQYSGRDTVSDADARYSLSEIEKANKKEIAELTRQLAAKTKQAEKWKAETKRTPQPTARRDDALKLAKGIAERMGSNMGKGGVDLDYMADKIVEMSNYIMRADVNEASYEHVAELATDAVAHAIYNSDDIYDEYSVESKKEMRALLKQNLHIDREDKGDLAMLDDGFGEFRKNHLGHYVLTNNRNNISVDELYQEFVERWGFDPEVTNPAEQLQLMEERAYAPDEPIVNVEEWARAEADDLVSEVIESVRQVHTFADKAEQKLTQAVVHERLKIAALKEQNAKRLADLKERNAELRKESREKIAKLKAEHKHDLKERKLKQDFAVARANAEERLLKLLNRVKRMKLSSIDRAEFEKYYDDIYTLGRSITGEKFESVMQLKERYDMFAGANEGDNDFVRSPRLERLFNEYSKTKYIKDMSNEELLDLTAGLLEFVHSINSQNRLINAWTAENTQNLISTSIKNIRNTNGTSPYNVLAKAKNFVITEALDAVRETRRITGYNDDDPLYLASMGLVQGQYDTNRYKTEAEKPFQKLVKNRKFTKFFNGKHAAEITVKAHDLEGNEVSVKITPALRTALYLHSLGADNMRHIANGGIVVPDIKLFKQGKIHEAYTRGTKVRFSKTEISAIASHMTPEEKEFARLEVDYFNNYSRDRIDIVYEALHGAPPKMVSGTYIPINVWKKAYGGKDGQKAFESISLDGRVSFSGVSSPGWLKERVESNDTIILFPADMIIVDSIASHSMYYGQAIPLSNFKKLWNGPLWQQESVYDELTRENRVNNTKVGSISETVGNKWGAKVEGAVTRYLGDIDGTNRRSSSSLFARLRSNYAGSVLEINPSVALKQTPSGIAAAAVIGYEPIIKAMTPSLVADTKFIDEMTAEYLIRKEGYSSQELGEIKYSKGRLPVLLKWIIGADLATTGPLLKRAAYFYVKDNYKALKVGGQEFKQKVVDVYNRILSETQPTYDVMYRSHILRDTSEIKRGLNMFKTQPLKNFNILYDAYGNMRAKANALRNIKRYGSSEESRKAYEAAKENFKHARKKFIWAFTSQIASSLLIALIQMGWDFTRGNDDKYRDKDGDVAFASWLRGMGINMLSNGFGMLPFGGLFLSSIQKTTDTIVKLAGEEPIFNAFSSATELPEIGIIEILIDAPVKLAEIVYSAATGDWESAARGAWKEIEMAAQAKGLSVANVRKLLEVTARAVFATQGKYVGDYYTLRMKNAPAQNKGSFYNLLYKAYKNDNKQYEEIYSRLLADGFSEGQIKTAMEQRMKDEQGVQSVDELESRYLSPDDEDEYAGIESKLKGSTAWRRANAEQRSKAENLAYSYVTSDTKAEEIAESAKNLGLSDTQYILYKLALDVVDKPNGNGKYGTYTNAEKEEALQMIKGR